VVNSRSQYNWFEEKPLFGKKILVPRPRKQAGELSQLLENYGAEVLEVPFIEIKEDYNRDIIANVFTDITSYEWVVFTSSNGVDLFFDLLDKAYEDIRSIGLLKIAAVGKATARAVRNHKLKVSLIPETANSNALADALIEYETLDNVKVLLVTGDKNSDVLFKRLQDEGRAIVDRLPLYKNIRTDLSQNKNFQRFKEEGVDCVLFTSSSTVHNYVAATESLEFGNRLKPKFGSIGVKTSETLRKHNLPIAFESPKANLDNFVVETLSYFRNNK
jgi:uroporphyrinogen-III synthase